MTQPHELSNTLLDPMRAVAAAGSFIATAGVASVAGGLVAWMTVRHQLAAERIVIPPSGQHGGERVMGPITALREASFVDEAVLRSTGGRTYAELAEDDPLMRVALDGALVRSSLMTSVLAFGVSAAAVLVGVVSIAIGLGFRTTARRLADG